MINSLCWLTPHFYTCFVFYNNTFILVNHDFPLIVFDQQWARCIHGILQAKSIHLADPSMPSHRRQDRHSHHSGQEGNDRAQVMVGLVKCVNKKSGIGKDLQQTIIAVNNFEHDHLFHHKFYLWKFYWDRNQPVASPKLKKGINSPNTTKINKLITLKMP